jgi:hypothetical protein
MDESSVRKSRNTNTPKPSMLLSEKLDNLKKISKEIFPKLVYLIGFGSVFGTFCEQSLEVYGINIEYSKDFDEELRFQPFKQVAIYLICVNLIEYFALLKASVLSINAKHTKIGLELDFKGKVPDNNSEPGVSEKLKIIHGLLIWQNADVASETDWETRIKLFFWV